MTVKPLHSIYQIKVSLQGAKPPIWRRLLVTDSIKLSVLHKAIQISMGWTDSHLHNFITKDRVIYGHPQPKLDMGLEIKDERKVRLSHFLKAEKDSLIYEYDFGDSWTHKIILEKILPFDAQKKLPYCVVAKRACPPEDCGGIWGYAELLAILDDPQHEEYDELLEWIGGEWDPVYTDRRAINQLLLEYCR